MSNNQKHKEIIESVLLANGIDINTHDAFLNPVYDDIEHTYSALDNIDKAVDRVKHAIENSERICVYGDFDVDGLTATSIMIRTLKHLGAQPGWYIPDRREHGHGLNRTALYELCPKYDLIITVDCGINDVQEVEYANFLGSDIIITDHHTHSDNLPPAYTFLYPPLEKLKTPFSGAGIAFKYAQALTAAMGCPEFSKTLLWLAALGTIVDCVEQTGENRIISVLGLKQLNDNTPACIRALGRESQIKRPINKSKITWKIAPLLNSPSRLGMTTVVAEILMAEETETRKILDLASQLSEINTERIETFKKFYDIAESKMLYSNPIVVVFDILNDGDARGLQGLVASRLSSNNMNVPTFAFTDIGAGLLKGSVRCPNHNFTEILKWVEYLILSGGGHTAVGGLSMYIENLSLFVETIKENMGLIDSLEIDTKIVPLDFDDIDMELYDALSVLEPYMDGDSPVFEIRANMTGEFKVMGKDKSHIKFNVSSFTDTNVVFDVVGWGMASEFMEQIDESTLRGTPVIVTGRLKLNDWNGQEALEIDAVDIEI